MHFSLARPAGRAGDRAAGRDRARSSAATLLGALLGRWMGWTLGGRHRLRPRALGRQHGRAAARARGARPRSTSERGRIAVGWLIVEDLAMVFALVLLPALGDRSRPRQAATPRAPADVARDRDAVGITIAKVAGFVAVMYVVGRRVIPLAAAAVADGRANCSGSRCSRSRSASPSARRSCSAFRSRSAPSSPAWCSASPSSRQRAAEESVPLREAFAVLFFVAVGMLFDPSDRAARAARAARRRSASSLVGKSVAAFADRAAVPPAIGDRA